MPRSHYPHYRTANSGSKRSLIVGGLIIIAFAAFSYSKYQPPEHQTIEQQSAQYQCDGRRRCSEMTSCAEAKFFLENCPGTQMDGDHDGIPCEQDMCSGLFDGLLR